MYNLHTHSLLSDGDLLPSEIAVRYAALGYKAIAITDHVDYSNFEFVIKSILQFTKHWPKKSPIKVFPGVEFTHLPLDQFKPLVQLARKKGIKIIVAHGETSAEPVIKGTNIAALKAGIDILAHPGLITKDEVMFARSKNIFLEITTRKGHSNTNQHVAKLALELGAKLILNHDSHQPQDIISIEETKEVGRRLGLSNTQISSIYKDVEGFLKKVLDNK
ncbi:MAG: histidinol phosphate phosphatase domain-containing protein [Candidatus Omnitrophica bacterium]|nr:histidinol phosphate phosphatase domain-containing protein [Candidatus Omnitrophota bacterium]